MERATSYREDIATLKGILDRLRSENGPLNPHSTNFDPEASDAVRIALREVHSDDLDEPILSDVSERKRWVIHPITDEESWNFYQIAKASFWTPEEIDFCQDSQDMKLLDTGSKHFIEMIMAFFAASDGLVNENLLDNFSTEVTSPEIRFYYVFQAMIEHIHADTYARSIDALVQDGPRKEELFNAISQIDCIRLKAEWAKQYTERGRVPFGIRCAAFAIVEGLFFSSSFCAIYWFKKKGLMPGLCQANELISRDEGQHCMFACHLIRNRLLIRPPDSVVLRMVEEAVEIEKQFVTETLPVSLLGMNVESMRDYVEHTADVLLFNLGLEKRYNTPNPFDWMVSISVEGKTNFFERRVSEYSRMGVGVEASPETKFSLNEDF